MSRSKTRHRLAARRLSTTIISCVILTLGAATAAAAPNNPTNQKRLDSTVRYLQEHQNPDGGFGLNASEGSNQDVSGWVAFALAAASINPQDQAIPGGTDAYSYLADHAAAALPEEFCKPAICTTSFERELLVVDASGTSPYDFGGVNLVNELLARKLPDGSFPLVPGGHGEDNDTIFAILSLSLVPGEEAKAAVQQATEWLLKAQHTNNGSWSTLNPAKEEDETDMTGAAIEALNAAIADGVDAPENLEAQEAGFTYLHHAQLSSGGFREFETETEANVASTAWAVQAIWSAKQNPENWVIPATGREPLTYLESLQQPDGHIRYREKEESNGLWMTAMVAPVFAGQYLPIPAVPRAKPVIDQPAPTTGSGVDAGGGGEGAPLFSRPEPQSRGHTPGGRRRLRRPGAREAHREAAERRRNPGHRRSPQATSAVGKRGSSGQPAGAPGEVKGLLLAAARSKKAAEAGAPGLRSAGESDTTSPLTIAVAAMAAILALIGTRLERRRPRTIL